MGQCKSLALWVAIGQAINIHDEIHGALPHLEIGEVVYWGHALRKLHGACLSE
jgi:hypothetical protein